MSPNPASGLLDRTWRSTGSRVLHPASFLAGPDILQVSEAFPSLTSLALMGNPVWPAARSRAANATTYPAQRDAGLSERRATRNKSQDQSSPGRIDEAEEAGGHQPRHASTTSADEDSVETEYRMHILRRLPRLKTLDCTDVSPEERSRASPPVSRPSFGLCWFSAGLQVLRGFSIASGMILYLLCIAATW